MDGLSGLFMPKTPNSSRGERILVKSDLSSVYEAMRQALEGLKGSQEEGKILLVIDQVDLLLAAGGDEVTVNGVAEMLMALREVCNLIPCWCSKLTLEELSCNYCHNLSGLSLGSFPPDTFRDRSCGAVAQSGAPS